MMDQSRKSSRMRVRFRDGGPPIGGATAWDASGWLTLRLGLANFLCDRRIHHGDDAERDPHHAHGHRQGGRGSPEVHGGGARGAGDRRAARRRAAGRLLGVPLQLEHRGQARRRRHRDRAARGALMPAIAAAETSAVTVVAVPGAAAGGNLTRLQIAVRYLVGGIGVAALLLPGSFEGTQGTAYQRLERRFGRAARRTASGVFLLTRALADCVRIFATAIPLAIITHWNLPLGILAIGMVTLVYTWVGGLRAVVWVDVIQLGVYLLGGIATLVVATHLAGGVGAFARAWDAGKLTTLDFRPSFTVLY